VSELVLCDQQDHIATLILNCPEKHNAMSPDMLATCCDHLERLEAGTETRVLVIRGQGTRAFTSGYDIGRLPERQGQERLTQSDGQGLFARVRAFPAPTIAMIHGYCMGGGLELAAFIRPPSCSERWSGLRHNWRWSLGLDYPPSRPTRTLRQPGTWRRVVYTIRPWPAPESGR
jgi:hypothetical protein